MRPEEGVRSFGVKPFGCAAFRTLKSTLDLRPMYHRISDRIRAHVLLWWPALLLVRVAENQVGS
ncbi:MAG: hypothetical protein ACOYES_09020 [Bacillota bacterium]